MTSESLAALASFIADIGADLDRLAGLRDGEDGADGRTPEFAVVDGWVAYRYLAPEGDELAPWVNLLELAPLKGADGTSPELPVVRDGEDGEPGADGRTPEFAIVDNVFSWRYVVAEGDPLPWVPLVDLATLKGADGKDAEPTPAPTEPPPSSTATATFLSGNLPLNGTTDVGPILQTLLDAGRSSFTVHPNGANDTLYFNTSVFLADPDVYSKVVIELNGAKISAGPNLLTTDAFSRSNDVSWVFFTNSKKSAKSGTKAIIDPTTRATGPAVGGLTRLYINNGTFDGNGRRVGLSFGNRTSVHFTGLVMYRAYTLVSWTDYADSNVLDHPQGRYAGGPTDAALVHQITPGDGLLIIAPKVDPQIAVCYLSYARGAEVIGNVTGKMTFYRSTVKIGSWHMEGRNQDEPGIKCMNSNVTISAGDYYKKLGVNAPPIVDIYDTNIPDYPSTVVFDCGQEVSDTTSDVNETTGVVTPLEVGPLVHISGAVTGTRVVARSLQSMGLTIGASNWFTTVGPRVTSTNAGIAAACKTPAALAALASGDWELSRSRDGFKLEGIGKSLDMAQRVLRSPVITDLSPMTSGHSGILPDARIFYAYALRNVAGQFTAAVFDDELAGDKRMLKHLVTAADYPAELVIWRRVGQAIGAAPEAYVSLPVGSNRVTFFDAGPFIGGAPWVTTNMPAVPTTNVTSAV